MLIFFKEIFVISGDIHYAEFTRTRCSKHIHGYDIHEFTSSGISHTLADSETNDPNDQWYHIRGIEATSPRTYDIPYLKEMESKTRYYGHNFGMIEFDFSSGKMEWQIRSEEGEIVLSKVFTLDDFSRYYILL